MARTIQSPGVQINEVDLSLRAVGAPPTTVFIPGFAPKGPTDEPILIGSLSEFEQVFGTPTNGAERYFYHTAKAVFQSPADVVVYRLPYGTGAGINTSSNYSALAYPVLSYVNSATSTNLAAASARYFFGAPTHVKLTESQYLSILRGDAFTWSASATNSVFTDLTQLATAGLIVLNKSQSSINQRYEGEYVAIIDNTNLNPATPFDDISSVLSINNAATATYTGGGFNNSYIQVPNQRLNFALSATSTGAGGSLSEILENSTSQQIDGEVYDDVINLGLFKLRQSVFSPDTVALDFVLEESYTASLDYYRQKQSTAGGPAISFYLDNVDQDSRSITTLVNPWISNKNAGVSWLGVDAVPTKKARFLSTPRLAPLSDDTASSYTSRMGAPSAIVAGIAKRIGTTDSLVALGDYVNQDLTTKLIGDVPTKVQNMLAKIENPDIYPLSVVVEGGLGTVYANSFNPVTSGYFDDTAPYSSAIQVLTGQNLTYVPQIVQDYLSVANNFVEFASLTRKDHMFIADPLTNIFVQGLNVKTLDSPTNTFSEDIYWPLRNQFDTINTSYVAIYANIIKVADSGTNRQTWVPFSGFAAAAYGNTDSNTQPWFAPAGFSRGIITGATDIGFYPTQKQRDTLYKISLNPIAFFPNEGFVIFGQKTSQKTPSAFDRINVRRLFLDLEVKTRGTVRSFIFEPNTLFTRTQIKNVLTPIFDLAKNTQGVYDYLIICDERNNTPSVIDDNALVVDIYLKPVRSAEFILVNFYATRTDANFLEIVA
jgi:hypothetical protein